MSEGVGVQKHQEKSSCLKIQTQWTEVGQFSPSPLQLPNNGVQSVCTNFKQVLVTVISRKAESRFEGENQTRNLEFYFCSGSDLKHWPMPHLQVNHKMITTPSSVPRRGDTQLLSIGIPIRIRFLLSKNWTIPPKQIHIKAQFLMVLYKCSVGIV